MGLLHCPPPYFIAKPSEHEIPETHGHTYPSDMNELIEQRQKSCGLPVRRGMFAEMRRLYFSWRAQAVRSLRAEKEPVNFYCSHRCTSGATLGQGRARCSSTCASRFLTFATLWNSSCFSCSCPYPKIVRPCIALAWPYLLHSRTEVVSQLLHA